MMFYPKGKNKQGIKFEDERNLDNLHAWLGQHSKVVPSGPPSTEVTCEELKAKVADSKYVLAYMGCTHCEVYSDMHLAFAPQKGISFVHTGDSDCAAEYGAYGNSLVFFRDHDEPVSVYPMENGETLEALKNWITPLMVPSLILVSETSIKPMFGAEQPGIMLFTQDRKADYVKVFEQAARANKVSNELAGYWISDGVTTGMQQKLGEFVGGSRLGEEMPKIYIL